VATGPCASLVGTSYVLQASNTGDFTIDGNYAQLESAFGSGYRTSFSANRQNAQQFSFRADCTFGAADGTLEFMVGGQANLHYVYAFASTATAAALVNNVNWEVMICDIQNAADNTLLACTAMGQSVLQATQGDPLLQIGDQNYGEQVMINLVPVPANVPRG
jgi:hypothetical protein